MDGSTSSLTRQLPRVIAILLGLACWKFPVSDPDLSWHLIGGAWIQQHHHPPTFDFINSFNLWWHDYHWLFQILLYSIFKLSGFEGLQYCFGIISACLAFLMFQIGEKCSQRQAQPIAVFISFLISWSLLEQVHAIRPQVLSLLLLALAQKRLLNSEQGSDSLYLLLIAVFAANIHVYWIFIPILWVFYRVVPYLQGRSTLTTASIWGGTLLLFLTGLCTPYIFLESKHSFFFINYALIYDYLLQPASLRNSVGELRETFAVGGIPPLLVLGIAFIVILGIRKRTLQLWTPEALSWLLGFALTIRGYKYVSLFALIGFPFIVLCASAALRSATTTTQLKLRQLFLPALIIALGYGLYSLVRYAPPFNLESRNLDWLPMKACASLSTLNLSPSHGRDHIRLMTHFNHGAWCRYAAFQAAQNLDIRVSTDGRTQWVPPEHFQQGFEAYQLKPGWLETLQQWTPDAILVKNDQPLGQMLIRMPHLWRLAYLDTDYSIFVPHS